MAATTSRRSAPRTGGLVASIAVALAACASPEQRFEGALLRWYRSTSPAAERALVDDLRAAVSGDELLPGLRLAWAYHAARLGEGDASAAALRAEAEAFPAAAALVAALAAAHGVAR